MYKKVKGKNKYVNPNVKDKDTGRLPFVPKKAKPEFKNKKGQILETKYDEKKKASFSGDVKLSSKTAPPSATIPETTKVNTKDIMANVVNPPPKPLYSGEASKVTAGMVTNVVALGSGTVFRTGVKTGITTAEGMLGKEITKDAGKAVITKTAESLGRFGRSMTTQAEKTVSKEINPALARLFGAFKNRPNPNMLKSLEGQPISVLKNFIKNPYTQAYGAVAGVDTIMSWLASDNILGGINIYTAKLPASVEAGVISKEDALMQLDEQQAVKNQTTRFIRISSRLNVLLMPFGKLLMTNANISQKNIDITRAKIEAIDMAQIEADNQYWANYRAKQNAQ